MSTGGSGLFSVLQQLVQAQIKDTATTARERAQAVAEKVVNQVVESEAFKKHVAFNVEEHAKHEYANEAVRLKDAETKVQMFPEAHREPIGHVNVFVSRVAGIKNTSQSVLIEVQVEDNTIRTPPSTDAQPFDWDRRMYDWDEAAHSMRFPVTDIKTGVAVRVMVEGVLVPDQLIGQVIIPLERFLPSIQEEYEAARKAKEDRKTRFVEGPTIYELFPLPKNRSEFQPAVKNSAKTGMSRPSEPLGYARIRTEFIPNESASSPFWVSKAYASTVPYILKPKQTPLQAVNLDVARTQRHVQRQLKRLESIFERIVFGPFAPTLPFAYARSWESKPFSILFNLWTCLCILYLPLYLFPMFMFTLLCVGGYLARYQGEAPPVVWNEDIRDPDDALNPMQRIAKLLWILETLSVQLVEYADFFERVIHAFGFRDERASVLLLVLSLASAISMSVFAYWVSLRTCIFLVFCAWMFSEIDFYARYQRIMYQIRSGKSVPYHPYVQPFVNLLMRIPTSERLGHLSICDKQVVKNRALIERIERIVVEDVVSEGTED